VNQPQRGEAGDGLCTECGGELAEAFIAAGFTTHGEEYSSE
jgi:hypothetical protein